MARLNVAACFFAPAILAMTLAPAAAEAPSAAAPFDADAALATSRAALGRVIGDHVFVDTEGRTVRLGDFRGRPIVINMIYTSCFHFCPTLTTNLAPKVDIAREALGRGKFLVLTIGFDARNDTPARMRAYAHKIGVGDAEWLFLSGDEEGVARLARDVGFAFARMPGGFEHAAQTTIIDGDGRVYRQVYGIDYAAPMLVEPLKALALGVNDRSAGVAQWLDRVRILCTIYDPRTGRYHIDYGLITGIAISGLLVMVVVIVLLREWRRMRRFQIAARK